MDLPSSSRRSFLKRTSALAVGLTATTLFTGLTHAAIFKYSNGTSCQRKDLGSYVHVLCEEGADGYLECSIDNADGERIDVECTSGDLGDQEQWLWCPLNDCY
jgi:hypothetical protein